MERTIQIVQPMKLAERKVLRVAAYARVSCDKDEMLKACKDGKIDRIITKSISRFARNTVTLLTALRDLRQAGHPNRLKAEHVPIFLGGEWVPTTQQSEIGNR